MRISQVNDNEAVLDIQSGKTTLEDLDDKSIYQLNKTNELTSLYPNPYKPHDKDDSKHNSSAADWIK